MPSERLSDEELATWIEQAAIDWPAMTGSILTRLTDEIRERRAADLSDEERVHIAALLRDVRQSYVGPASDRRLSFGDRHGHALFAIDRLLGGGE